MPAQLRLRSSYRSWGNLLLAVSACLIMTPAAAQCYKITTKNNTPSSAYYTEPGKGTVANWDGAVDTGGSRGTLPPSVNMNSSAFQPDGTLLATGVVNFLETGAKPYNADQILFRCSPDEAGKMYEYYATNGDSIYAGKFEVGASSGVPEAYQTYVSGMALRATNLMTGEYYSRYWKARPLTSVDTDSRGWFLVKAKDFSNVKVELLRLSNAKGPMTAAGMYNHTQPNVYIAFKGGTIASNLQPGRDSMTYYDGFAPLWPGSVNLHNRLQIRRSATCSVTNVTPTVVFPLITVAELKAGGERRMPVTIRFNCQTGAPASTGLANITSGVNAGQTAMGILVKPESASAASEAGLVTSGAGVTYLLSDGYGTDPSVATGVGIQITRTNGVALNMLVNLYASLMNGNNAGWYPALEDATPGASVNGVTTYTKTLYATLKALPGKAIKPGKVNATAQVIIQVQ